MFIRRWEAREVGKGRVIKDPVNYYYFFLFNARRNIKAMNEVASHLDEDTVFANSSYRYVLFDRKTGKEYD